MKPLGERQQPVRYWDLEKRIQGLEWKIQTSSLSLQEEKELVEQVRVLETQRVSMKKLRDLGDSLTELQTETKALGTQAKLRHDELSEIANQSQKFHKQIIDLSSKIKSLRQSADEAHQKYIEYRQQADHIHKKYVGTQQQIRALKEDQERKEKQRHAEKEQALRIETTAKIREKMKRGERLTLEEFKLLSEQEEPTEH
jgi:phosphoserine phosphatase